MAGYTLLMACGNINCKIPYRQRFIAGLEYCTLADRELLIALVICTLVVTILLKTINSVVVAVRTFWLAIHKVTAIGFDSAVECSY